MDMLKLITVVEAMLVVLLLLTWIPYVVSFEICGDFISCQLAAISLSLPDQCDLTLNGEICLSNVICADIALSTFTSTYEEEFTIRLELHNLNATCHGNWTQMDGSSSQSGKFIAVANNELTTATFMIESDGFYPTDLAVSSCDVMSTHVVCEAHDGLIPAPLISDMIERIIEGSTNSLVCDDIIGGVASNSTTFINELLVPELQKIGSSEPSSVPELPSETVDWGLIEYSQMWNYVQVQHNHCFGTAFGWILADILDRATDGSGAMSIPLEFLNLNEAVQLFNQHLKEMFHLEIEFHKLKVAGLDSFTGGGWNESTGDIVPILSFANAMSQASVDLSLAFDQLEIGVDVVVIAHDSKHKLPYKQPMELLLDMNRFTLNTDLLLAVNRTALASLFVDQLLQASCLKSTLLIPFNISDLNVSYGSINIQINALNDSSIVPRNSSENGNDGLGSLEEDAVITMNAFLELMYGDFSGLMAQTVFGLFEGPVREEANHLIQELSARILSGNRSECNEHSVHSSEDIAEWTDANSKVIGLINDMINERIGVSGVNDLMLCMTNSTGAMRIEIQASPRLEIAAEEGLPLAEVLFRGPLTAFSPIVDDDGVEINSVAANANPIVIDLAGLDSFFNFSVLAPNQYNHFELGNAVGLGYCSLDKDSIDSTSASLSSSAYGCSDPSYVPFTMSISKTHYDREGHSKSTMSLELTASNMRLVLDFLALMDRSRLKNMRVGQLSTPGCVLSTFNEISVANLAFSRSNGTLTLSRDGEVLVDKVLITSKVFELMLQVGLVEFLNSRLENKVSNADSVCTTGEPVPTPDSLGIGANGPIWVPKSWELGFYAAGTVLVLSLWLSMRPGNPLAMLATKWATAAPAAVTAVPEDKDSSDSLHSLASIGGAGGAVGFTSDAMMYQSEFIPLSVRLAVPVGCIFAAYMLIYSTIDIASAVHSEVQFDGETVYDFGAFFKFTLTVTVRDMYFSGAELLACAVAFFSGAWPFLKLMITFGSWVLPTRILPLGLREELLFWMDLWGKWAMSCTLVITVLAVGFHVTLPLSVSTTTIITSVPGWGYYSMLFGQAISMVVGHLVLSYHHRLQYCQLHPPEAGGAFHWPKPPPPPDGFNGIPTGSERRLLRHHVFSTGRGLSDQGRRARAEAEGHSTLGLGLGGRASGDADSKEDACFVAVSRGGQRLGTILIIAGLVAAVFANWLVCFDFSFLGATGYMMGSDNVFPYSVLSLVEALPSATGIPMFWEVICLKWFLFLCCVAMPLIMMLGCLVLWVVPLSLKEMVLLMHVVEISSAWNILDIMLVCIVSTVFEIHRFAVYIVGSQADGVDEIINQYAEDTLDGDNVLIDVQSDFRLVCKVALRSPPFFSSVGFYFNTYLQILYCFM